MDLPCSGARALLLTLLAFAGAAAICRPAPLQAAAGFLLALASALAANVLRITVLAIGIAEPWRLGGIAVMEQPWHDLIGLATLALACAPLLAWAQRAWRPQRAGYASLSVPAPARQHRLRQAYGVAQSPGTLRIVVFLSDGYVGNEPEILRLVSASVGQGRLYAFGIGSAVNRYLIEEMARHGRGLSRIIDPTEKSHEAAVQFASRLKTPVLTDIQIDWGSLKPRDVTPALIPDLFEGDSIRIQGRFEAAGTHLVKVPSFTDSLATVSAPTGCPMAVSAAASLSMLFDTQISGRVQAQLGSAKTDHRGSPARRDV